MLLFLLSYWKLQTSAAIMQIFKWFPMKRLLLVLLKRNHSCLTYFDQKWYFWEPWTCFCNGSVLPWSIMGCCFLWPHYQAILISILLWEYLSNYHPTFYTGFCHEFLAENMCYWQLNWFLACVVSLVGYCSRNQGILNRFQYKKY